MSRISAFLVVLCAGMTGVSSSVSQFQSPDIGMGLHSVSVHGANFGSSYTSTFGFIEKGEYLNAGRSMLAMSISGNMMQPSVSLLRGIVCGGLSLTMTEQPSMAAAFANVFQESVDLYKAICLQEELTVQERLPRGTFVPKVVNLFMSISDAVNVPGLGNLANIGHGVFNRLGERLNGFLAVKRWYWSGHILLDMRRLDPTNHVVIDSFFPIATMLEKEANDIMFPLGDQYPREFPDLVAQVSLHLGKRAQRVERALNSMTELIEDDHRLVIAVRNLADLTEWEIASSASLRVFHTVSCADLAKRLVQSIAKVYTLDLQIAQVSSRRKRITNGQGDLEGGGFEQAHRQDLDSLIRNRTMAQANMSTALGLFSQVCLVSNAKMPRAVAAALSASHTAAASGDSLISVVHQHDRNQGPTDRLEGLTDRPNGLADRSEGLAVERPSVLFDELNPKNSLFIDLESVGVDPRTPSPVTVMGDVEEHNSERSAAEIRAERFSRWLAVGMERIVELTELEASEPANKVNVNFALMLVSIFRAVPARQEVRQSLIFNAPELKNALEMISPGGVSAALISSSESLTLSLFKGLVGELEQYAEEIRSENLAQAQASEGLSLGLSVEELNDD